MLSAKGMRPIMLLGILGIGAAFAQVPEVKIPPAPIAFEEMEFVIERPWAREYRVSFPTPRPSGVPQNDIVPLRIFLPRGPGPSPVVLVLHYLGATDLRVERTFAEELARRGIASAVLALPYHLERTPPGRNSGELAILPDVTALRANLLQSVSDTRRALDFLAQRTEFQGKPVAIAGVSLGAVISALVYGVDTRLDRAAFVLGGADLAGILWRSSRVVAQRDVLRKLGYTEDRLGAEVSDLEPLTYLEPRGSTMVVQAAFDSVIPRAQSDALIKGLGDPKVLKLETGHYGGVFVQRRLLREVATFLEASFDGKDYTPPKRILAPTVRIGVMLSSKTGLDLGAGLDVLRFDSQGKTFGSLFATPRGVQFLLGRTIDRGLAGAVNFGSGGVGVGLFWSAIL